VRTLSQCPSPQCQLVPVYFTPVPTCPSVLHPSVNLPVPAPTCPSVLHPSANLPVPLPTCPSVLHPSANLPITVPLPQCQTACPRTNLPVTVPLSQCPPQCHCPKPTCPSATLSTTRTPWDRTRTSTPSDAFPCASNVCVNAQRASRSVWPAVRTAGGISELHRVNRTHIYSLNKSAFKSPFANSHHALQLAPSLRSSPHLPHAIRLSAHSVIRLQTPAVYAVTDCSARNCKFKYRHNHLLSFCPSQYQRGGPVNI
jgi:hypothetical protein